MHDVRENGNIHTKERHASNNLQGHKIITLNTCRIHQQIRK